jgi:hypothetical protein
MSDPQVEPSHPRSSLDSPEPRLNCTRELVLSPLPWIVVYAVLNDVIHVVRSCMERNDGSRRERRGCWVLDMRKASGSRVT